MSSDGGNAAVDPEVDYIAAETFEGAKEGYTFTTHNSDVGYYKEGFTPEAIAPDGASHHLLPSPTQSSACSARRCRHAGAHAGGSMLETSC